jgi:hypothetical protein
MSSEELIRDLCARAVVANGGDFAVAVAELHAALKAHIENLRALAAAALVAPPASPKNPPRT